MAEKILFVDDDANLLASCERNLRRRYPLETAAGGELGFSYRALAATSQFSPSNGRTSIEDKSTPSMQRTLKTHRLGSRRGRVSG